MSESKVINAEAFKPELEKILQKYNLPLDSIEFVDEFPNEPYRSSLCYKIQKKIKLKRLITEQDREAAKQMLSRFGPEDLSKLDDDWGFVKQAVLKHVCGINERWKDAHECEKWAFYNMRFF